MPCVWIVPVKMEVWLYSSGLTKSLSAMFPALCRNFSTCCLIIDFELIGGKDSARRAKNKKKSRRICFFSSEPQPILAKQSSARRAKNKKKSRAK